MTDMIQLERGRYVSVLKARPFVIVVPKNDRSNITVEDIVGEQLVVIGNVVGPADRSCFKTVCKTQGRNIFVVDQIEAEIEEVKK